MLNLPNLLSLSRVVLAPAIIAADHAGILWLACLLLAAAVVTDLIDGPIARRKGIATPRGTLIDHGCDAFFVSSLCAWLAYHEVLPIWLSPLIAIAVVQYLLDAVWLKQPGSRPSRLGKFNGIGYYVAVVSGYIALRLITGSWFTQTVQLIAWLLILATVGSIMSRLYFTFTTDRQ